MKVIALCSSAVHATTKIKKFTMSIRFLKIEWLISWVYKLSHKNQVSGQNVVLFMFTLIETTFIIYAIQQTATGYNVNPKNCLYGMIKISILN